MQCGAKVKKNAAMPNEISPPENGTANTGLKSSPPSSKMSWPSLFFGLTIMLGVTIYPFALADRMGKVDHWALMLLMWSMTASIIRGVGFIPSIQILKLLFSGFAAILALMAALALYFL